MFIANLEEDFGDTFNNKNAKKTELKMSEMLLQTKEEFSSEVYDHEIENDDPVVKSYCSKSSKKYVMHTTELKRMCVEMAQISDLKSVADKYGVSIKSLKRWMLVGPKRKKGGGRKIRDPEMENRLYEWYFDYHLLKKLPVTSKMIKNKALEFTKFTDFNASKGWLEKIKKKYKLEVSRSLCDSTISEI